MGRLRNPGLKYLAFNEVKTAVKLCWPEGLILYLFFCIYIFATRDMLVKKFKNSFGNALQIVAVTLSTLCGAKT